MPKDTTYWFPHDYEPTSDPKMQAMLSDYGGVGYGIFWRIIEMLHSDSQHILPFKKYIYLAIAKQMQASGKQRESRLVLLEILPEHIELFITDCIHEYELLEGNETHFFSHRVSRNVEKKKNLSETRSISGKNGAIAKQKKVNGEQNEASGKQGQAIRREEIRIEESNNNNNLLVKNSQDEKFKKQFSGNFKSQGEESCLDRLSRSEQKANTGRKINS